MIKEFALDPKVISGWQEARYFLDQFGVPYGRMISRFPNGWVREVYQLIKALPDSERGRIEEKLNDVKRKMVSCHRPYNPTLDWLRNAEEQHSARPFQAIIAKANPGNSSYILLAEEVSNASPLWCVPTKVEVPRKASSLVSAIEPLLFPAKKILLVDPHFDPGLPRFCRVLEQLVKTVFNQSLGSPTIEYHARSDYSDAPAFEDFEIECQKNLPLLLPSGFEVTFIRWAVRRPGIQFHERYILTDLGGVKVDPGLDEGPEGHMCLLELDAYDNIWARFQRNVSPTTYELEGKVVVVGI